MRVLLTGATGYIGSHAAAALRESGHDVVALVRDPGRLAPALDPHGISVEQAVGSMTDADAVASAMQGCDAIVHTAGEISLDGAEKRDVELLAQKLQEQDHPVTTFVLGGVYGPISPSPGQQLRRHTRRHREPDARATRRARGA